MSQIQSGKPSLPSIQFLLQETPGPIIPPNNNSITTHHQNKRQFGHRTSRSVSSLPLDLQSLSLQAPEEGLTHPEPLATSTAPNQPYGGIPFSSIEKPPSWMLPTDRIPVAMHSTPTLSSSSSSSNTHKRRSAFHASHVRPLSEFTLPPLSHTTGRLHTAPLHYHRRAVSDNTMDCMLSPSPNAHGRAQSYSPQESSLNGGRQSPPDSNLFDQLKNNNTTNSIANTSNAASDTSGRYTCSYCPKKFSRPSSLRIHTYSHTGEKPFECSEPGCGRHFSVQSNMRRHLRVHRLGRSIINNTLEATKEENEAA